MKTQEQENKMKMMQQDEIDLSYILRKLNSYFRGIGESFVALKSVIFRNTKLLLVSSLLGILLGYATYYITKPYYISSMTLVLADIRNEFVEDQLVKLMVTVEDDNYEAVAEMLDVSYNAAKQIKSMKFSNLDAERIDQDSVLMGSPFRIELSLYDNRLFNSMEPALANYLENNRYFSKLKRIRQREVESIISKLKSDINSIDSIKTSVVSPRGPVSGFVYGEPIDPTNLYRESITMYQQQVDLEAELDQLDNIQIVNGFTPRSKPTGPRLALYILGGLTLSLIAGIFVAVKREAKN